MHTVPLTISYHLFQFLIGQYSVAEIRYFIKKKKEMKMKKSNFVMKSKKKKKKKNAMKV